MRSGKYLRFFSASVLISSTLLIASLAWWLPAPIAARLIAEGGIVESTSAALWFAGALALVITAARGGWGWSAAFLLAAFGFRELGLRKQLLGSDLNVMKIPFWVSEAVPWTEKALVALTLTVLIVVLVKLLYADSRPFFRALRISDAGAQAVLAALALLAVSQWIDGGTAGLQRLGIAIGQNQSLTSLALEECMELAAAALVFGVSAHACLQKMLPTHLQAAVSHSDPAIR